MEYDVDMKFACGDKMSLDEVENSPEEWFDLWVSCIPIEGAWNIPCVRCWNKQKAIEALRDAAQAHAERIQFVENSPRIIKDEPSEAAATGIVGEPLRDLTAKERAAVLARNIAKFDADLSKIRDGHNLTCGFCGIPIEPVTSEVVGIQHSCGICAAMCKTLAQRPYWVRIHNVEREENRRRAKAKQRIMAGEEDQKFL